MALFGRDRLTCHYCNTKTRIKYDGLIKQWDCLRCGERNYLDKNGEIADAPVATSAEAHGKSDYAVDDLWSKSHIKKKESDPFCPACLNNQRKLAYALGEIHLELDENHPEYYSSYREYLKNKKELEKLYPVICEHCVAGATGRIMKTKYLAQSDYVGKMLAQSRRRTEEARVPWFYRLWSSITGPGEVLEFLRSMSLNELRFLVLRSMWYSGVLSQALFHIAALYVVIHHRTKIVAEEMGTQYSILAIASNLVPSVIMPLLSILSKLLSMINGSRAWAIWSLVLSVFSCQWHPYTKEVDRNFTPHLSGFASWYSWTAGLLFLRGTFFYVVAKMDLKVLADPYSFETGAAHAFMLLATALIVQKKIRPSIKKDMGPVWVPRPQNMPDVKPVQGTISHANIDIADVLDEIARAPSKPRQSLPFPSQDPVLNDSYQGQIQFNGFGSESRSSSLGLQPGPTVPISTQTESITRQRIGAQRGTIFNHQQKLGMQDSMDWSPDTSSAPQESVHRAFLPNPAQTRFREKESFNQAPTNPNPSNFWYKVPPAPITPAQRALKAGQTNFHPPSQEVKENFFQTMTQRKIQSPQLSRQSDEIDEHRDYEMAQPKFFPPSQTDDRDDLADCFGSFGLSDTPIEYPETKTWRFYRFVQFIFLLLSFLFWNIAPLLSMADLAFAAMLICSGVALAIVPEHLNFDRRPKRSGGVDALCAGLGILEIVVALSCLSTCFNGLHRILFGYQYLISDMSGHGVCQLPGNMLILLMLLQEFGAASIW